MTDGQAVYLANSVIMANQVYDLLEISYDRLPCQISCPFHKQGLEQRRSARLYEDGLFCFTCGKQYRSVELLQVFKNFSAAQAARFLLDKFSVTEADQQRILSVYNAPRKKSPPQALMDRAQEALLQFKHQVPLEDYFLWVKRWFSLGEIFLSAPEDQHWLKLQFFKAQMMSELDPLRVKA